VVFPTNEALGDLKRFVPEMDKQFYFDKALLKRALTAYEMGRPFFVTGPTGSGKSDFHQQFFARCYQPAIRVQCNSDLDMDYLFGSKGIKAGETVYEEGVLSFARRHDVNVCLDEVDALRENTQLSLNGYLENKGPITLTGSEFNAESEAMIHCTGHQSIWATSNTGGKMMARPGFGGTGQINKAVLDRFLHAQADYLPAKVEAQILAAKTRADERHIWGVISAASVIRNAYVKGDLTTTLSTRSLIDWLIASEFLGISDAFEATCMEQAEIIERETFLNAYATGMGHDFTTASKAA
jgi:nitric oxide reductase NorQ protein/cobaltochelatase CobS